MNRHSTVRTALIFLLAMLLPTIGTTDDLQYQDYALSKQKQILFELIVGETFFQIELPHSEGPLIGRYNFHRLSIDSNTVRFDEQLIFDNEALHMGQELIPFERIHDIRIQSTDDLIRMTFYTRDGNRAQSIRRGNIVQPNNDITIEADQFVRGVLFSVIGDINVYGEVNKDIVTLFGNVYVASTATVRGDVATIAGTIDVSRDASIYGVLFSGDKEQQGRLHRFRRRLKHFSLTAAFGYNRVDGAAPKLGFRFDDPDSLLPRVWGSFGYAFESKRARYEIGLEQLILRKSKLAIGVTAYRRLSSGDDWLLKENENFVFAFFSTDDFKDYYEAGGGSAWLRFRPYPTLTLESRYVYEETNWLDSHPLLWSLFGGDKLFRSNYSSVAPNFRTTSIQEIDTTVVASLSVRASLDTRDPNDLWNQSFWTLRGEIEFSSPDINSDFDYRRYRISIRRYQKIHRRATLLTRFIYGGSNRYLPMHKRYYAGGLGSLRGYKHKEFMGTEFWLGNLEYRISFPRSVLGFSIFWDGSQIANDVKLSSANELKQNLGVAAYLGNNFRLSLAKRLDRSFDDDLKVYVRFANSF